MSARVDEFLNLVLWAGDVVLRPSSRNVVDSREVWAYRNGIYRRVTRLERQQFLERKHSPSDERVYRLTEPGRVRALGGRDPEVRWSRTWDGLWRNYLYDVPAGQDGLRQALRRALRARYFGYLQNSVWITPDPPDEERQIIQGARIDVESLIVLEGRPCAGESDAQIVKGAWNFERINRRYQQHLEVLRQCPGGSLKSESARNALLRWIALERQAWIEAVAIDPLLPRRILPPDYLGEVAWRTRIEVLRRAGSALHEVKV